VGRALLLVALNHRCRPGCRAIRILTELAAGPALSQEIPALIELDLKRVEANLVVIRQIALPV
jgi:hypothetical protein